MGIGLEVKKYNSMRKKVFLLGALFLVAATVCLNIFFVLPGIKDPVSLLKFSRTRYVVFSFALFVLWTGGVALFLWLAVPDTMKNSRITSVLARGINAAGLLWLLYSLILSAIGFSENVGTIRISSAEELSYIRNYPSGEYVLTKDIDLEGEEWKSISAFKGSLSGNGHSIINITVGEDGFIKENLGEISSLTFDKVQYLIGSEEQQSLVGGSEKTEEILIKHQYTIVSFSESSFWKIGYNNYVCELCGSQYSSLRVHFFNWVCVFSIFVLILSVLFVVEVIILINAYKSTIAGRIFGNESYKRAMVKNPLFRFFVISAILAVGMLIVHCYFFFSQQPEVKQSPGETVDEPLTAYFEEIGLTCDAELDISYPYTVLCSRDRNYTTTGRLTFSDYDTFESDGSHEALEGYEWQTVIVTTVFDDENAKQYGFSLTSGARDYYLDISVAQEENYPINYNGKKYDKCQWSYEELQKDGSGTVKVRYTWCVPKGYDGNVVCIFQNEASENNFIYMPDDNADIICFRLK